MGIRIAANVVLAVVVGGLLVVVGCMVAMALAFVMQADFVVPGLFHIWTSAQGDGIAVNLDPDLVGLGVTACVVAAVCGALATWEVLRTRTSGVAARGAR